MEKIDFVLPTNLNSLGLLGYMIIVNKQVHSYQLECVEKYLNPYGLCLEDTCLSAVISGNGDAIPFDNALQALSKENQQVQESLYYLLSALANVDGHFENAEKEILDKVERSSRLDHARCMELFDLACENASSMRSNSNILFKRPYPEPITLKGIIRRLISWLCMLFRKLLHLPYEQQSEDTDYETAIEQCAKTAKDDFAIVQPVYERLIAQCGDTVQELKTLKDSLSKETSLSADVSQAVSAFSDCLSSSVLTQAKAAQSALCQKERILSDFTISLLGRTKAGKSTLHSILTGLGRDRSMIGAGMQRTTRYNRVYQWNLLRLIDTPGIGSAEAEGRKDEEIVASILEESDIICFVAIDDSILKDILEFIKKIADLNKPIIILLNHKENIEPAVKFKHFIAHPTDWQTTQGEDRIQGYVEYIYRYAKKEGFDSLLSVFPVFLLPALMAGEKKYARYSKLLWDSSNIDCFIEELKKWITVFGPLKRSQTLIDGAVQGFTSAACVMSSGLAPVQDKVINLERRKPAVIANIRKYQDILLKDLKDYLTEQYGLLETQIALSFAEEYWNYEEDISNVWGPYLERIKFGADIQAKTDQLISDFSTKIDDTVREVFEDFYFSFQMDTRNMNLHNSASLDLRSLTRILGGILNVAGGILSLIPGLNLVGGVLFLVGTIINLISGLFKSEEEKRREGIDKLYGSLRDNIHKDAPIHIDQVVSQVKTGSDCFIEKIDKLFDDLIDGLNRTIGIGHHLTDAYQEQVDFLNTVYAWRILTFLMGKTEAFCPDKVEEIVSAVERDGNQIRIVTPAEVSYQAGALKNVIAEEIKIVNEGI